jgi:transcriptional regulator EpsA
LNTASQDADTLGTHAPGDSLRVIEALLKITQRHHFFQWAQGELQALFPHEALICCLYGRDGACVSALQFAWQPYFSDALLAQFCKSRLGIFADLLDSWRGAAAPVQIDLADLTAQRREQDGLALESLAAFSHVGIHGVRGHDGNTLSVFAFMNTAATADVRRLKSLELVVPHMHGVLGQLLQSENQPNPIVFTISPREREVLQLIRNGKTNPEIAQILFLSPDTVKSHVRHIFTKLNVTSRSQAVAVALAHRLIDSIQ